MTLVSKIVMVFVAVGVTFIWKYVTEVPPLPKLERTWWASSMPYKQDESIKPFKIIVQKVVLEDLNRRLESHLTLTPPLEGTNFEYGFNTDYLKQVVAFWRNEYNWRDREIFLNQFPQFKTRVSGLDLHFIHVQPSNVPQGTRVLPIMLLHGWPGSVRELYSLIPLLTTPRKGVDFVFEVIVPSLPGYGYSQGASKPGMGVAEVAVVMNHLMERIGHKKYYVQGGDWGSLIGTYMGNLYPENVIGLHLNMCASNTMSSRLKTFFASFWPSFVVDDEHAHLMYPLTDKFEHIMQESGYMHLQATKPDTIGAALRDSPVGLAAYILEKFSTWTDPAWRGLPDGGLTKKYTLTDLLDNVMIYWVTGSITTSMRLYSETLNKRHQALGLDNIPCMVPTACAAFPNELMYQSESIVKGKYPNLVRFSDMPRGGHFAAFEEPNLMADEIWETVKIIQKQRVE